MSDSPWRWYWLCWLLAGFLVPETIAIITKGKTFSNTVWHWFGVKQGISITQWTPLHWLLCVLMAVLFLHFVYGAFD